jgi:hypothetical protein
MKRLALLAIGVTLAAGCGGSSHPSSGTNAQATSTAPKPTDANGVAQHMIQAGLPASVSIVFTAANDPNQLLGRQGQYTSKVSLQDQRLPKVDAVTQSSVDGGGSIECFSDSAGAKARYEYLKGFQSSALLGDGYDYVSGKCVLRLTKKLTPAPAAQYEQLFRAASP